jgi:putative ATP-dependent endonuclease of OLD family
MRLGYVGIRNYRGIGELSLPIDPITTLIGENAYGKSNLLDALLACLGPGAADGTFAFTREDLGALASAPLEIELGFRETAEREWCEGHECAAIAPYVYRGQRGDRRISFRVTGQASEDDGADALVTTIRFVDGTGKPLGPPPPESVTTLLRARCPFILLKADRYFTRPSRSPLSVRPLSIEERLAAEIGDAYRALMQPHELRPDQHDASLHGGMDAARAYIERFGGDRLRDRVRHFLPELPHSPNGTGVSLAARSMALMLVIGALLDARAVQTFGPGSLPILAIEDAEAHLHPVLLAAVASIMKAMPAQKIVTTNSGELLSMLPLPSIRRLVRTDGHTLAHRLERTTLGDDELRRIGFHVKANRGGAFFARAWLLVEGETEFWLLPQLAELLGTDLTMEGIRIMEFAQCGVEPLVKLADDLGIGWHLLADGDNAGRGYIHDAERLLKGRSFDDHVTQIADRDIEHLLWRAGYAEIYRNAVRAAVPRGPIRMPRTENPTPMIERALRARTKPGMAVEVADAATARGAEGVPAPIRAAIEAAVRLARRSAFMMSPGSNLP